MPELPEVETITRDLQGFLHHKTLVDFEIFNPRVLANHRATTLAKKIRNHTVLNVTRRAKYLILTLSSDTFLVFHLRMTGELLLQPTQEPHSKHIKVLLRFSAHTELHYNDIRAFGRMWFFNSKKALAIFFQRKKLGPEPLGNKFTESYLTHRLQIKKQPIKTFLLNQSNVAGIGNIYANEILWKAQIHPKTKTHRLKSKQKKALYHSIPTILQLAIQKRGTTISDFKDCLGVSGEFQHYLCVHQKEHHLCPRCGSKIKKIQLNQRGTFYCPKCQHI